MIKIKIVVNLNTYSQFYKSDKALEFILMNLFCKIFCMNSFEIIVEKEHKITWKRA